MYTCTSLHFSFLFSTSTDPLKIRMSSSFHMIGLWIGVFIMDYLEPYVTNISVGSVACGAGGVLGNKGEHALYIYIYIYDCMFICMYVCMYMYICLYVCKYVCMYTRVHIILFILNICVTLLTYPSLCVRLFIYVLIHRSLRVHFVLLLRAGAVCVRMDIHHSSVCFACAHLAAHQGNNNRNEVLSCIQSELTSYLLSCINK